MKYPGEKMSSKLKTTLTMIFLLTLLIGSVRPFPVLADSLAVTSIDPPSVFNDVSNIITINGSGFDPAAQVSVIGYVGGYTDEMALPTTFIDSNTLEAGIVPGFSPGIYSVTVTNPGLITATLLASLTVSQPIPTATPTPAPFVRPQIALSSYSTNASGGIRYGKDFILTVRLANSGKARAEGVQVTFVSSELNMLKNGGVVAIGGINKGEDVGITQSMTAANYFYGVSTTALEMNVSYFDDTGTSYNEKFVLHLDVYNTYSGVVYATATPTGVHLSQLVISEYKTDLDLLQPGLQFKLDLTIQNKGDLPAKSITMIVGGGSVSSGGGTPGPSGVSGSSGDFSNFAPVGTSNVQSLGDIPAGSSLVTSQQLIVNVNTTPGAYPVKITLSYTDSNGAQVNDEQVITLLVYRLPNIDISFYQPVYDLYTNQSNILPIQVINLGRNYSVLGNIAVTSDEGSVENGLSFVGGLDTGGYFTLDAMFTPMVAGEVHMLVTIEYTDDFNQSRTITKTLTLNVIEMEIDPSFDPNNPDGGGYIPVEQTETFLQKIWRFILGLFGLDSSVPVDNQFLPGDNGPIMPEPIPAEPGGKG